MPWPSDLISEEKTTANKKNGSQNQNQVAPVSGVPQRSNTMRFRLRAAKFPKKLREGICIMRVGNSQSRPILKTRVRFVSTLLHLFTRFSFSSLFSINRKKPHKAAGNSCGLMCLESWVLSRLFILWVKATQLRSVCTISVSLPFPSSPSLPLAGIVALVGGVLCRSRLLNKTFGVEKQR